MLMGNEVYINGDGETSRDFCYIANTVQMNLLAATTVNSEATNQIYNVAVGDRTSLNQLYDHLRDYLAEYVTAIKNKQPIYCDFRAGDVRHSLADISKCKRLLGYQPTHRIVSGLAEAIDWYVTTLID